MPVVIGLVLHASHRGVFEDAVSTLAGVRIEWVTYDHEGAIRPGVVQLLGRVHVDGLMLGPVPYAKCRDLLPDDLAVAVIRSGALELALAFSRALRDGRRPVPVSIDTFDQGTVDEVVRALDLEAEAVACLPYDPAQRVEEIVEFHRRHLEVAGGDYVISLRTAVAAELGGARPENATPENATPESAESAATESAGPESGTPQSAAAESGTPQSAAAERGAAQSAAAESGGPGKALRGVVPVVSSLPGPSTLRAQLHELALRIQSKRAAAQRFAAGVFVVVNRDGAADLERARVGLMHLLVNTPEFADAWIENRDRRGVVVFAHQALFEGVTHNWVSLAALAQAQETLGIRVAAGFGIGASARTSVLLAERAVARAEQEDGPCAYLIEDSGVIIGPMGLGGEPLAYTYRGHGADLEQLARGAGLSAATLSRLAALESTLEGRPISPNELATALGITEPSGRRLIRKLGESGLVTDEGSAQPHRKGRPTRLYRLAIGAAVNRAEEHAEP
jgi:DNA-binding MarR family transcriptional regulator